MIDWILKRFVVTLYLEQHNYLPPMEPRLRRAGRGLIRFTVYEEKCQRVFFLPWTNHAARFHLAHYDLMWRYMMGKPHRGF